MFCNQLTLRKLERQKYSVDNTTQRTYITCIRRTKLYKTDAITFLKQRTQGAVHLFTYYAINAVYILQHLKQLTTVGMLLLA